MICIGVPILLYYTINNVFLAKKIELLWTMIQNNNYHSDEFVRLKEEVVKIIGVDDSDIIAMNRDILRKTNEKNK